MQGYLRNPLEMKCLKGQHLRGLECNTSISGEPNAQAITAVTRRDKKLYSGNSTRHDKAYRISDIIFTHSNITISKSSFFAGSLKEHY